MRRRYLMPVIAVAGGLALVSIVAMQVTGQPPGAPKGAAAKSGASKSGSGGKRTAWGDPDLQGTWFVLYDTPLERSNANASKEFLTDAEVEAANKAKGVNPGRNMRTTGA